MGGIDETRNFGPAKRKKDKNFVRDKTVRKRKKGKKINSQAKGKRGEKEALEQTMLALNLTKDDIRRCVGQERGTDFKKTSDYARDIFFFAAEVKNQEKPRFWECWEQAKHNGDKTGDPPLLLIKRNNQKLLAVLDYDILLTLLVSHYDFKNLKDDNL